LLRKSDRSHDKNHWIQKKTIDYKSVAYPAKIVLVAKTFDLATNIIFLGKLPLKAKNDKHSGNLGGAMAPLSPLVSLHLYYKYLRNFSDYKKIGVVLSNSMQVSCKSKRQTYTK